MAKTDNSASSSTGSSSTGAEALEDVQPQQPGHEHEGPQVSEADLAKARESERGEIPLAPVTTGKPAEYESDEHAANAAPSEAGLSDEQIVYRRTSDRSPGDPDGPVWPLDGRYRRVFTVEVPRTSSPVQLDVDWNDEQHEAMHTANMVATLQEALNKGLHPRGPATFDGVEGDTLLDLFRQSGRTSLVYSVDVVPASVELPEEAALAYTPSAAILDMGGTTLPDDGSGEQGSSAGQ